MLAIKIKHASLKRKLGERVLKKIISTNYNSKMNSEWMKRPMVDN